MKILLALGANLPSMWGNPAETLSATVEILSQRIGPILAQSPFFQTDAYPPGSGPKFVNAALALQADQPAAATLAVCHAVEAEAQRTRDQRWGPRTLDIDLLACGDMILPDAQGQTHWRTLPEDEQGKVAPDDLILPHPRLQERAFVLVPLMHVAPGWRHPVTGQTVTEMHDTLPAADRDAVIPLDDGGIGL